MIQWYNDTILIGTREFNALKEKLENIERVQRLAAVQRKQDLKDGKVKAESGAGSGAEEQYQLDRESESREVDTYRKQIEKLRSKSTTERQELQVSLSLSLSLSLLKSLGLKGIFLYNIGVMFHVECCIRLLALVFFYHIL